MNNLAIKIVGPAGFGIKVTGFILAKFFLRLGKNVFAYTEYPSLIRGGHNIYQVDISGNKVNSSKEKADILIALSSEALAKELKESKVKEDGLVIVDKEVDLAQENLINKSDIELIKAPLIKSAEFAGNKLMKNIVALGVLLGVCGLELDKLNDVLQDIFAAKEGVAEKNILAARAGYDWVSLSAFATNNPNATADKLKVFKKVLIKSKKDKEPARRSLGEGGQQLLMTGNQACALGVVAAGCQVYVAYPMTPASEILHVLEAKQEETGILVHQPEDEIAGIHVAIGASFAGARAATGTSGGGFALMNEGFSLLGMTETPLVVFEVMRPAPATGNPTWSDQGDLKWVVSAAHGEFPRVVVAPGLPEQCFDLVQHAFNLAEKFQTPVIVLSDKHLGESTFTVSEEVFNEIDKRVSSVQYQVSKKDNGLFKRYQITTDGVSPRTLPGTVNGEHIANSDEHDEFGYSDESSANRIKQMDKRMKKTAGIIKEIPLPKVYGQEDADITLVCWGSALGACIDAVNLQKQENKKSKKQNANKINVIHFSYVWPMPDGLDNFLAKFKKLVLVENNKTGQLGQLIRQETGIEIKDKILKYDSRPFWQEEIASRLSF